MVFWVAGNVSVLWLASYDVELLFEALSKESWSKMKVPGLLFAPSSSGLGDGRAICIGNCKKKHFFITLVDALDKVVSS